MQPTDILIRPLSATEYAKYENIIGPKTYQSEGLTILGALYQDQVIGVAACILLPDTLYLACLYVESACRKQKVGTRLLQSLTSYTGKSRNKIIAKLYTGNFSERQGIVEFFRKNGWSEPEIIRWNVVLDSYLFKQCYIDTRFGEGEDIWRELKTEILTFEQLENHPSLIRQFIAKGKDFKDIPHLVQNPDKEKYHLSLFLKVEDELVGWIVGKKIGQSNLYISSLYAQKNFRHMALGFHIICLLFNYILQTNNEMKTFSFSIEADNKRLLNCYRFLFRESIIRIAEVWDIHYFV